MGELRRDRTASTNEPSIELITRAKNGDTAATESVVLTLDRFVAWVAARHVRPTAPLEDLMQAGRIGILKALERYDPARGVKLSTFAKKWVEGEVRAAARDPDFIRLPAKKAVLLDRAAEAIGRLSDGGQSPSIEDVARDLSVNVSELEQLGRVAQELLERPVLETAPSERTDDEEQHSTADYSREQVKRILHSYPEYVSRARGPWSPRGGPVIKRSQSPTLLQEQVLDIEDALSRLDEPLFEAVELREFYDLGVREAAQWLGVHENTVRNRYSRGIEQLTELMNREKRPPPKRRLGWAAELEPVESILSVVRRYRPFLEMVFDHPFFENMEVGWVLKEDEGWVPLLSRDIEATASRMRMETRPLPDGPREST